MELSRASGSPPSLISALPEPFVFPVAGIPLRQNSSTPAGAYQSAARDFYEILGVSRDANHDEIEKAFHALAKKYHPDANKNNPSAKRKFQEIREAYETLEDPENKTHYDRLRQSSKAEGSRSTGNSNTDWNRFKNAHGAQFSDSFHTIFSEIFENETGNLGGDIQVEPMPTFAEVAKGCTKHISFDANMPCDSCMHVASCTSLQERLE